MKPENMPKSDFIVSILLMCFAVWVVVHSLQMPRFQELGADPMSVPGIVPGILGSVIFLLSLTVFIRSLRRNGHRLGISRRSLMGFMQDPNIQRMSLTTLICIIYGLAMIGNMNYYLATFLFVLFFLLLFQYRSAKGMAKRSRLILSSVVQALLTAGIVGAVFRYLFLVDLP